MRSKIPSLLSILPLEGIMQFFEKEIKQVAEFAFSTFDLKINPRPSQSDEILEKPVTSRIEISGGWQGAVSVIIEWDLAQRLAEIMFGCDKGEATKEEMYDAIAEMTNVIGGNIKSLLPQPSQLSLPVVDKMEVRLGFPLSEQVSQVAFDCGTSKFKVDIHQATTTQIQAQPTPTQARQAL
jgi:chemotaxis protein CheX